MWMVFYAMVILNVYKNIDLAIQYCDLDEKNTLKIPDKYSECVASLWKAMVIAHWQRHIKTSTRFAEKSLQEARDSGNMLTYSVAQSIHSFTQIAEAKSVQKTIESLELNYKRLVIVGLGDAAALWELVWLIYKNFAGGITEESERFNYLANIIMTSKSVLVFSGQKFLSTYYYFQEDVVKSIEFHFEWFKVEESIRYELFVTELKTINALSLMSQLPKVDSSLRRKYQNRIKLLKRDVAWAAKVCPVNYLHHHLFLKAYEAQINKKYAESLTFFNQAVRNAKKGDFYLWIALGYELIGELCVEMDQSNFAIYSFRDARYYYGRYGMLTKVRSLEKRYPDCAVEERASQLNPESESLSLSESSSGNTSLAALDFISVIKASHAISGEIVLEKLFEKMLHVIVENAGATKAILLEIRNNVWLEAASLTNLEGREEFKMLNDNSKE
jgi:hypothetical protein